MRKLAHDEIARPDPAELDSLPKHPISVLVEDVRSIYNVGSIFRTSDACRIEKVYLTGITGTPENRKLHKSALGAQDTVAWEYAPEAPVVADRLQQHGYSLVVLEHTTAPSDAGDVHMADFPLCLVVGNELTGVSDALIGRADMALELPQYGAKQSLHVAVAYGVALYDLVRRYRSVSS